MTNLGKLPIWPELPKEPVIEQKAERTPPVIDKKVSALPLVPVPKDHFPGFRGKMVRVLSEIDGACAYVKRAFQALITYMSYSDLPVFSKSTTMTFEAGLNTTKVRNSANQKKDLSGAEGWKLGIGALEDPLEAAHPRQFVLDIHRQEIAIEGTRSIEMPEEEIRDEIRQRTVDVAGSAIASFLNEKCKEREDITPKEIQLLRYQIEDLMSQKLQSIDMKALEGFISHYLTSGSIIGENNDKKRIYTLGEKDGTVTISVVTLWDVHEVNKETGSVGKVIGYDAIRNEVIIDMGKMTAKDLLFAEGCATVRTESYGFRPKKEEIIF